MSAAPPLKLLVLDMLAEDAECLLTMKDRGEMPPTGLARFDDGAILDGIRGLLDDGMVSVERATGDTVFSALVPEPNPGRHEYDLRLYWYSMTPEGERAWKHGADVLDAWYEQEQR